MTNPDTYHTPLAVLALITANAWLLSAIWQGILTNRAYQIAQLQDWSALDLQLAMLEVETDAPQWEYDESFGGEVKQPFDPAFARAAMLLDSIGDGAIEFEINNTCD